MTDTENNNENLDGSQEVTIEENHQENSTIKDLSEQLEQANQEVANLKNQLLLQLADGENLRKRTAKQVEDASKFAVNKFAKDLIEVLENLSLAINNAPIELNDESNSLYSFHQGVILTKNTLVKIFAKHGITQIIPNIGDSFDHNIHEAVTHITSNDYENNSIIDVLAAGYLINERLLKPAMVVVTKNTQN